MDEDLDPSETGTPTISHRGILIIMAVLVAVGAAAGFVVEGPRFGLGVLLGGVLAYLNYWWLASSTKAMFGDNTMASTGILAAKYILRYMAILGLLLLIFWSDVLPVTAVILGLTAFAFAVVVRGFKDIFSSTL